MKFYNGKKVVGLYHRGHKVLYQYHRGRLVYSGEDPYAYGGYIKEGLVLQLDCRQKPVGNEWQNLVGDTPATINGSYSGGGIEGVTLTDGTTITLPTTSATYWEVCKVVNGEVSTIYTLDLSGTIFSVRGYVSELSEDKKSHNLDKDNESFAVDYPFVFAQEFAQEFE